MRVRQQRTAAKAQAARDREARKRAPRSNLVQQQLARARAAMRKHLPEAAKLLAQVMTDDVRGPDGRPAVEERMTAVGSVVQVRVHASPSQRLTAAQMILDGAGVRTPDKIEAGEGLPAIHFRRVGFAKPGADVSPPAMRITTEVYLDPAADDVSPAEDVQQALATPAAQGPHARGAAFAARSEIPAPVSLDSAKASASARARIMVPGEAAATEGVLGVEDGAAPRLPVSRPAITSHGLFEKFGQIPTGGLGEW